MGLEEEVANHIGVSGSVVIKGPAFWEINLPQLWCTTVVKQHTSSIWSLSRRARGLPTPSPRSTLYLESKGPGFRGIL